MIKTDGIDHVVFFVKDYKKSRKFYEDVLNMTLAFEQPVGVFMNAGPGHLLALFQKGLLHSWDKGRPRYHDARDVIGGSEKIPVFDVTAKYVTPDLISAYTIDQIHGAAVITALTDTHQLSVFTAGDDEKIITFANVSAWIVDELEAIATGTTIISGDKLLYVDGGVLKQIDIDAAQPDGTTALHWASHKGDLESVRLLLRAGATARGRPGENTTIGVVATNAQLTQAQATVMAQMAHDGFARAIAPSHTPNDGDAIFALATGLHPETPNLTTIGALAADVMAEAIVRAVRAATGIPGDPAARDLPTGQ